ncbi:MULTISPECIES: phosphatase PAP2 family protein [Sphingobium]|uniref:phosphatase PAP2 family protein n=1 Tax=Sphingobium TaxID=165695 RepID=UPI000B1D3384|nr:MULTISPECIES: phosphatase PAP2 family protein [Sphingobium]
MIGNIVVRVRSVCAGCLHDFRHSWPVILLAMLMTILLAAAATVQSFHVDIVDLAPLYVAIIIFLASGLYILRRTPSGNAAMAAREGSGQRLGHILVLTGLFYFMAATAALGCAALARTALPYADTMLAAADRALYFDWLAMMAWFQASPRIATLLIHAYAAINWQPQLAILLLCGLGHPALAYRFMTAWGMCLLLTIVMFPFFPAVAAFHHYNVDPAQMPGATAWASWHLEALMEELRSGAKATLDSDALTGIITMPSFHAASAILLIFAFWPFPWLRWPFLLLNMVMFASAVPVGGHYLVDTLGGLMLALIAIGTAIAVHGRGEDIRLDWKTIGHQVRRREAGLASA